MHDDKCMNGHTAMDKFIFTHTKSTVDFFLDILPLHWCLDCEHHTLSSSICLEFGLALHCKWPSTDQVNLSFQRWIVGASRILRTEVWDALLVSSGATLKARQSSNFNEPGQLALSLY